MKWGKAIAVLRVSRGWTQTELAKKWGVHSSYVSLIENGHREPTLQTLRDLCKALKVEMVLLTALAEGKRADFYAELGEWIAKAVQG
jgi:transcriptional regulator with XRE-family HTH domain